MNPSMLANNTGSYKCTVFIYRLGKIGFNLQQIATQFVLVECISIRSLDQHTKSLKKSLSGKCVKNKMAAIYYDKNLECCQFYLWRYKKVYNDVTMDVMHQIEAYGKSLHSFHNNM